ncbi:hypothetical protein [Bacillus toyonensis]|uniref:hypothetical protein n=1 Tax=Bacillus toyonensis TaxID=155322 RepID=UPI000BF100E6|nr:hypothetical protein [Bacillus toyonensis]PEK09968.1 hypothetical protein CN681_12505 [Bacillus toyonensis]PGA52996.1 hypothetical protein COL86_21640 [Bacillus toyonensis]PGB97457.1 hypothetical protein COM19_19510 [Bacillus toyonensis]
MFEEKLLNFYEKKLNLWNLIYKHLLKSLIVVFCSLIFVGIVVFWVLYVNLGLEDSMYHFVYFIYFVAYISLSMFILNEFIVVPAQSFSIKEYGITFKSSDWRVFIYFIIRSYLYEEKILVHDNNSLNKDSLEFLIKSLEKRKEEVEKYNIFTVLSTCWGIFFLFSMPVWSGFNSWIFNHGGFEDLSDAVAYFVLMISFIAMLVFSIWMPFKMNFLDDILNKQSSKISFLITALSTIRFALDNSNYIRTEKRSVIKKGVIKSIIKKNI